MIAQFSLDGIGSKTYAKFIIGHWSVLIHLSVRVPFVGFVNDIICKALVLVDIC